MATTTADITSDKVYALIMTELNDLKEKGKGVESSRWLQRFTSHIRVRTGTNHANIVLFHNNGCDESTKLAVYTECYRAFSQGNPELLQGSVPAGQSKVDNDVPKSRPRLDFSNEQPTPIAEEPAVSPRGTVPEQPAAPPTGDDAAMLMRLIQRMASGSVNEERVQEIAADIVDDRMAAARKELGEAKQEQIGKQVDTWLADAFTVWKDSVVLPPRQVIEVRSGDRVTEITGVTHRQLPQIITWVNAGVPLWVWGGAGAGKTHLFYQVAKALGLEPNLLACDETLTIAKLVGYKNLVNGEFVEGLLYRRFAQGGLQGFDEIDTCSPAIACVNSLIANDRYLFPSGETVTKHSSWACLAFANTKGVGAVAGYSARNRLDAATLDRFAVIELAYDPSMEMAIATGDPQSAPENPWQAGQPASSEQCKAWVEWVQKVRAAAGTSVLISPRASVNGVRALKAGIPVDEVAEALVFKLVAQDTRTRLINAAGEAPRG